MVIEKDIPDNLCTSLLKVLYGGGKIDFQAAHVQTRRTVRAYSIFDLFSFTGLYDVKLARRRGVFQSCQP